MAENQSIMDLRPMQPVQAWLFPWGPMGAHGAAWGPIWPRARGLTPIGRRQVFNYRTIAAAGDTGHGAPAAAGRSESSLGPGAGRDASRGDPRSLRARPR